MSKYFVGFWNVSVILTYASLLCAVGGICMCAEGNVWAAVILIVCAGTIAEWYFYQRRWIE